MGIERVGCYLVPLSNVLYSGTQHWQGYIEFTKKVTLAHLKDILCFEGAHWEPRRGTQSQAIAYCSKQDTRVEGPWTFGDKKSQGKRSDLLAVKEDIDDGATVEQLWDNHFPQMVQHEAGIQKYINTKSIKRDFKTKVTVLMGPPGCGKTRYVMDKYPNAFFKNPTEWWDGYQGQEVVVFDDFYGWMPYHEMLRIMDRYPHSVNAKGTMLNFAPRKIFITSNTAPHNWWNKEKVKNMKEEAIYRRITKYIEWNTLGGVEVSKVNVYGFQLNY